DVPREAEDYVHRIGRTARAGAGGSAVTLVSVDEQHTFGALERFLGYEVRKLPLPDSAGEGPEYNPGRRSSRSSSHGRSKSSHSRHQNGGKSASKADKGDISSRQRRRKSTSGQSKATNPSTADRPAQAHAPENITARTEAPAKKKRHYHRRRKPSGRPKDSSESATPQA
ncbi:MAG: ATP-dependent helicase, partial [Duncaniella sp.]|nr:ATP-dependent helicase [Duncaniella sp.]